MGVYIKGMEMPRGRGEYDLRLYVDSDGTCTVEGSYCSFEGEPFDAVPVTEHGDLIDRDALEQDAQKRLLMFNKNDNQFQKPYEVMRAIALAPTIIEAEEGET